MRRATITFRLDAAKKKALDEIASGLDRDRSWVLNEAVGSYIDVYRWQVEHIKDSLRQAKAGIFASDKQVAAAFKKFSAIKAK